MGIEAAGRYRESVVKTELRLYEISGELRFVYKRESALLNPTLNFLRTLRHGVENSSSIDSFGTLGSEGQGYPPKRKPATVGEEERGGRDTTSRRTSTRAASERRPPPTTRHAPPPRTSTSPLPRDKTQSTAHTSTNEHPHCREHWVCVVAPPMHAPPSSPPPSFTQSPSLPRSLVRDGQTSPHRLRLVVSRGKCPLLSPSSHANSFVIGTAAIETHTQQR